MTHPSYLVESLYNLGNLLVTNGNPKTLLNRILYNMTPPPLITNMNTDVNEEDEIIIPSYANTLLAKTDR